MKRLLSFLVALLMLPGAGAAFTLTPTIGLKKPAAGETGWGPMINYNSDILDNALLTNGSGLAGKLVQFTDGHQAIPTTYGASAVVLLTGAQTLNSKDINTANGNLLKIGGVSLTALSGSTGTVGTTSGTLTNGNLAKFDASGNLVDAGTAAAGLTVLPFSDASNLFKNSSDATKLGKFSLASLTTATTRTLTWPDANGTIALNDNAKTFTNTTYDTAGSGNIFKIAGTTISSITGNASKVMTESGALTSQNLLKSDVNGNATDAGFALASKHGTTTTAATTSGSFTTNNCIKVDSNGNFVDAGVACGGMGIQDEAVTLPAEPLLNFTGANITCTDVAGIKTSCAVGGPALSASNVWTDNQIIDNQKEVRWRELTTNGTNYIGIKAPGTLTADKIYTLPTVDGSSGDMLTTNGSGVMSWTTPGGGTPVLPDTNSVAFADSSGFLSADSNQFFYVTTGTSRRAYWAIGSVSGTTTAAGFPFTFDVYPDNSGATRIAASLFLESGWSGSGKSIGLEVDNLSAGTGTGLAFTSTSGPNGDAAAEFFTTHSSAGNKFGSMSVAAGSAALNAASYNKAISSAGGTNIGTLSKAASSSQATNFKDIGGYFSLASALVTGDNVSSAIVADGNADDIFRGYGNGGAGTLEFRIDNTGGITTTGGATGLSVTTTVRNSAGTGTCTLIYTNGLRTGGSC